MSNIEDYEAEFEDMEVFVKYPKRNRVNPASSRQRSRQDEIKNMRRRKNNEKKKIIDDFEKESFDD